MPELPEVEVIKEGLKRKLKGRMIKSVDIICKSSLKNISTPSFGKRIIGKKFESVSRRGKFIIFPLDSNDYLVIHLKMTGQLVYCLSKDKKDKYTCLIFTLDNGCQLRFMDMRKFGTVQLVEKLDEITTIANMGPEPLEDGFRSHSLKEILKKHKQKIKTVLLDQHVIAGLGNIYAVESLFRAGINPERPANRLTGSETEKLYQAIRDVLKDGIAAGGTSTDTYRNSEGTKGKFQHQLQVYQREGVPCSRCGTGITQVKISGRGTYFCPGCQK